MAFVWECGVEGGVAVFDAGCPECGLDAGELGCVFSIKGEGFEVRITFLFRYDGTIIAKTQVRFATGSLFRIFKPPLLQGRLFP